MRLRSLILFQICKLQCEFDRELSFDAGDLGFDPLLLWIGFRLSSYDCTLHHLTRNKEVNPSYLTRNKDDAYVEDKVTMGLLLLAGSHKVCPGYSIQVCYYCL